MLPPKMISSGWQPRNRAAAARADSMTASMRRLVA